MAALVGEGSSGAGETSALVKSNICRFAGGTRVRPSSLRRPGLSDGCFVFSGADRDAVVSNLNGGALIHAFYEKP